MHTKFGVALVRTQTTQQTVTHCCRFCCCRTWTMQCWTALMSAWMPLTCWSLWAPVQSYILLQAMHHRWRKGGPPAQSHGLVAAAITADRKTPTHASPWSGGTVSCSHTSCSHASKMVCLPHSTANALSFHCCGCMQGRPSGGGQSAAYRQQRRVQPQHTRQGW